MKPPSNRTIEQLIERRISYASNDAVRGVPGARDRVTWWRGVVAEYRKEVACLVRHRREMNT